jgi:poly(3-hydroxybutyrate) depolymerase
VPNADGLACPGGDADDDGVRNDDPRETASCVQGDTSRPCAQDPCVPLADTLACPTGDADDDGVANGDDRETAACPLGDTTQPCGLDPCVPDANVLACPGGDADGDGVRNDDARETASCAQEDTFRPCAQDPCVPLADALACPTGDADDDGVPHGAVLDATSSFRGPDVAPLDPCLPNPNDVGCGRGDLDRDGTRNVDDDDDENPCIPDQGASRCTRRSPGCDRAAFDPSLFVDALPDGAPDGEPDGLITVSVDGVQREAAIRFPVGYDHGNAHPIVVELHGDQNVGDPLDPSASVTGLFGADEYDARAIVIALHGQNLLAPEVRDTDSDYISWNTLGRAVDANEDGALDNNDIAAVRAFKALVAEGACVDPTRTFVAGFSGGAFFAQSLRCFDEDMTALATFQGGLEGQPSPSTSGLEFGYVRNDDNEFLRLDPESCARTRVPQLIVHGALDGTCCQPDGQTIGRVTREQSFFVAERWALQNGCTAQLDAAPTLDPQCAAFKDCAVGADVVFCEPADVAHEVWNSTVLKDFFIRFFPPSPG